MNDRTTIALAEALREHDHDIVGDLPAQPVIAGARRRRTRRRALGAAGAVGATALVVGIALTTIAGRPATSPVPAGSDTPSHAQAQEKSAAPRPSQVSNPLAEAYSWASSLPTGSPFQPVGEPVISNNAKGVLVYQDKGGSVALGNQPLGLVRTLRAGTFGEDTPSTTLVLAQADSTYSVWAVRQDRPRSATKLWSGAAPLDLMGGQHSLLVLAPGPTGGPLRIIQVDLETGADSFVELPPEAPKQPRLATWKNGEITVIDGEGASETPSYTWSERAGWVTGPRRWWVGPATLGFEQYDLARNLVMTRKDGVTCAHLMDGPVLDPREIVCGDKLTGQQAPTGSLVLIHRLFDGGGAVIPTVVDLADGSPRVLPVGELESSLRWESNLTLVGQVLDESGQHPVSFRIDLGKSEHHERLPEPLPQG